MNFGYNKVRPYLDYNMYVVMALACNLPGAGVVIVYVSHFNKSSLKAVTRK